MVHSEGRLRRNGFVIFRPQFQPSFTGSFVWRNTITAGVKLASVKYESITSFFFVSLFESLVFSLRHRSGWPSWTWERCVWVPWEQAEPETSPVCAAECELKSSPAVCDVPPAPCGDGDGYSFLSGSWLQLLGVSGFT